jgi:hypothetical protein
MPTGTACLHPLRRTFYPGDTITFVLENGTQIGPDPFLAIFSGGSDGVAISTGGDFYNFFVLGLYPVCAFIYVPKEDNTDLEF